MRFSEKLPKLRKDNNLSQEQLAEKLNVSRQAVSKWEAGSSYPDMEKMLLMCKVLNCTLEDLLDDGSLSNNQASNEKFNINTYIKDLLSFITKSYNMFCAMKFKEKLKCLLEMSGIFLMLFIAGFILSGIFQWVASRLLYRIPLIGQNLESVCFTLFVLGILVLGAIIFLHLFKIRYLDYYVTVEDNEAKEKSIEKAILEEKIVDNKKYIVEGKKEKIVIRDPKHSTLSFFNLFGKIITCIIKFFLILFAMPLVIGFIGLITFAGFSLYHLSYGILFFLVFLIAAGSSAILGCILHFIYNFILNKELNVKKIGIILVVSLVVIGLSSGLSVASLLNYEHISTIDDLESVTSTEYIKINDDTSIYFYLGKEPEYVINNSLKEAEIEITYPKQMNISKDYYKEDAQDEEEYENQGENEVVKTHEYYHFYSNVEPLEFYKLAKEDLKNKAIRSYESIKASKVTVYLSQKDYNTLMENNTQE